jgi:hypothetical protein
LLNERISFIAPRTSDMFGFQKNLLNVSWVNYSYPLQLTQHQPDAGFPF